MDIFRALLRHFRSYLRWQKATLANVFHFLSRLRFACRQEALILAVVFWLILTANFPFWSAVLQAQSESGGSWKVVAGLGICIAALYFLPLAFISNRYILKPLLAVVLCIAAVSSFYMEKFGVYINTEMMRNVLHTDVREAGELLTWDLWRSLLFYLALPFFLLYRVKLPVLGWRRALLFRFGSMVAALFFGVGLLFLNFQDLAALMRNHKEIRYLITPGNVVYSLIDVLGKEVEENTGGKTVIAPDAVLGASWAARKKPVLFVIVVGETARFANWGKHAGPDGKPRQTTPELDALPVIQFTEAKSCGTNTEVSLPCMFSLQGRRHYNEKAIRNSESLLHVLDRLGFHVVWKDNQSGCKGVCSGLIQERLHDAADPELCDKEGCFDEILLKDASKVVDGGNIVLILHTLGNHGPAYYRRYPKPFRQFTPTCDTQDLGRCSREEIVNSYDNAILYTDHFLARVISFLEPLRSRYDTAMIYASDHGESLGENGLFLHGMPYAITPKEQIHIPMFLWISPEYLESFKISEDCLKRLAKEPASHDNLFHSILGFLDVETKERDRSLDFSALCRR